MKQLEQFDEKNLVTNPFSYTLTLPVTEVISNINYTKDPEDGIITNSSFYQERFPSTRIYQTADFYEVVASLSPRAHSLLLYIIYKLLPGKDYIQINTEFYMSKNGISSINTYKEAKKELIRYSFIAPTEYKTVFWINPNMFFNGNRLKKYKDKIRVINTWEQ